MRWPFSSSSNSYEQLLYLTHQKKGEVLVISQTAVSFALMRTEGGAQVLVYYTSKALHCIELEHPILEKLAYALLATSRKLRPYFQAHTIDILIDKPKRKVLDKPDQS